MTSAQNEPSGEFPSWRSYWHFAREVSRHYAIRADYGLYEYSCFVWHGPQRPPAPASETWWER